MAYNYGEELLVSTNLRIKEIPIIKPVMNITDDEPIFMNYEEYFTDKVYDILDIKN